MMGPLGPKEGVQSSFRQEIQLGLDRILNLFTSCPQGRGEEYDQETMMKKTRLSEPTGHLFLILTGILITVSGTFITDARSEGMTLDGSTMLFPLEKQWVREYERRSSRTIRIRSDGSGAGIERVGNANVEIGSSDVFLSDRMMKKYPKLVAIPVALSGVAIFCNLPDKPGLRLNMSGAVLARIFLGKIRYWDDAALQNLNPGVRLPHQKIVPVHRKDPSGSTFVLTDFLTRTSRIWFDTEGRDKRFPLLPGPGAIGSHGLVKKVSRTPGSLGYAGLSWAKKCGCPFVALENKDGFFVAPSPTSFRKAALEAFVRPDFPLGFNRSIVWDIPGKEAYPAANFEYFLINAQTDDETMKAIRTFLLWVLGPGQNPAYTETAGFGSLPWPHSPKALSRILHQILQGNSFRVVSPG